MPASEQPWDLTLIVFVTVSSPTKHWTAFKIDAQCFLNWSRQAQPLVSECGVICHKDSGDVCTSCYLRVVALAFSSTQHHTGICEFKQMELLEVQLRTAVRSKLMVLNSATSLEHNVICCGVNKTLTEESLKYRFREMNDKSFEGLRGEKAVSSVPTFFSTDPLPFLTWNLFLLLWLTIWDWNISIF